MLTWIEINRSALEHNITQYKNICAPALFAPVIKSNAYGHGIELIAQICEEHPDVDWMCVVSISEAVKLRQIGITKPLLVLSILDISLEHVITHTIDTVIYTLEDAQQLSSYAQEQQKYAYIHIKIDTGLSRAGFLAESALPTILKIAQLPWLRIRGMFTHFANSEDKNSAMVNQQLARLEKLRAQLHEHNIIIPLIHSTCSAAITGYKNAHSNFSRAGIGIYGLWPSQENKDYTLTNYPDFTLQPVLTWKTKIIQIKTIPAHTPVGYDVTFTTQRETKIALLPVGYWDGYERHLSNKGHVIVYGIAAPVVGRIAMNLMMIDVTDIAEVTVHDEVILLGKYPEVTAEKIAEHCNTINYEVVTHINPLLPRIVVK